MRSPSRREFLRRVVLCAAGLGSGHLAASCRAGLPPSPPTRPPAGTAAVDLVPTQLLTAVPSPTVEVAHAPVAQLDHCWQLWGQYKLRESKQSLDDLLRTYPHDPEAQYFMALLKWHYYHDDEEALRLARASIAARPSASDTHALLGHILLGRGQYAEAEAAFRDGLGRATPNLALWLGLGKAVAGLGRRGAAIAALKEALAIQPQHAETWRTLHRLYVEAGAYEQALATWTAGAWLFELVAPEAYAAKLKMCHSAASQASRSSDGSSLIALANTYAQLGLYEDAAWAYRQAANSAAKPELERKLDEVDAFLQFEKGFAGYFDELNRQEALAGQGQPIDLEPVFRPIRDRSAELFPELGTQPATPDLARAMSRKYGVLIRVDASMNDCHDASLGFIADMRSLPVELWGRRDTVSMILLRDTVCNGFASWYRLGQIGIGGWSDEPGVIVVELNGLGIPEAAIDDRLAGANATGTASSQLALDATLAAGSSRTVAYAPELAKALGRKGLLAKLAEAGSREALRRRLILDTYHAIVLHESQHALDAKYLGREIRGWEGEYRCKLAELANGNTQLMTLSSFVSEPLLGDQSSPHDYANAQILSDVAAQIADHPGDYPQIDTGRNMLAQFTLLEDADIRRLAIATFRERYGGRWF